MLYIWHEDSKDDSCTQQFWTFLKEHGWLGNPDNVEIEGFEGNVALVEYLEKYSFTDRDLYIILLDYVPDNSRVLHACYRAETICKSRPNIYFPKLLCSEYLFLQTHLIEEWITSVENKGFLAAYSARAAILDYMRGDMDFSIYQDDRVAQFLKLHYSLTNVEQIAAKRLTMEKLVTGVLEGLLNSLSTEFTIAKKTFGVCWHCDCCEIDKKNLICKLRNFALTSEEKAECLWYKTLAKDIIERRL